ncbi:endonuclease MutS2 [Aggregatilineales bacterium SYSU G02658]
MISDKSIQTLELDKILEQVARLSVFSAGAELVRELQPTTNLEEARLWQRETAEAVDLLENKVNVSLAGVRDVRLTAMNAARGVLIDTSVLLDIKQTLRRAGILKRTLAKQKNQFPLLAELVEDIDDVPAVQDAIERAINDAGEIRDTATAKLAIIRSDLKISLERLQSKLNRILTSKRSEPILQEAIITQRSGRYVIPIKAEYKGRIPGIVHDSSSSGATLFIEPLETVELNNHYRELQLEEEKEIRRILTDLTDQVGQASEKIVLTVDILAQVDFTLAKAQYALQSKAVMPQLVEFRPRKDSPHPGSTIVLRGARHPLLTHNVVPIDVEYDEATWVLVVTGPNTGGKTVALKTVGLMALMAQCGLHLPAEEARLSVFEGIFADIGDEQSIEQSLSTFSAHMTNIIAILRECDDRSLVILDEMGAGTDPAEGSALARALLNRLLKRRVTTMVSTHHPELKIYAVETKGVRNASVEFNLETLAPTYRLVVGLPGRSNALAIARRLGLDEEIIDEARGMVATEDLVADDLLDEIQRTRQDIRQQHETIDQLRAELQAQRDALQARIDAIEDERRRVLQEARENAEKELEFFRRELRKMQKEMQLAGMPLDKIKALQEAAQKMIEWTAAPVDVEEIERVQEDESSGKVRVGDAVFLNALNAEGTVVELDGRDAVVQVGTLRVRAKVAELRKRNRSERRAAERSKRHEPPVVVPDPLPPRLESPGLELDLRGESVEDALKRLDYYVDAAYMAGLPFGRIIHGKGTGKLREAVRQFLTGHRLVSKIEQGLPNEGGAGVTVVHLVPSA